MQFIPTEKEMAMLEKIVKYHPEEYAVVRLTDTMLHKAIIDASAPIRTVLTGVVDYGNMIQGSDGKVLAESIVITDKVIPVQSSFYRPKTKKGDPRLWIYGLKKFIGSGDMIYITVHEGRMVVIPLTDEGFTPNSISEFFGHEEEDAIKAELILLLSGIAKEPEISVAPDRTKSAAKDVGETFEKLLGILPNSDKVADFKSKIELKSKRAGVRTSDTLFSMVPDWKNSYIPSSNEMIRQYGYPSKKYPGFMDLFVTVSNKTNNQGLSLEVDEENNLLYQLYEDSSGKKIITCSWNLSEIKERLLNKHPETVWVVAEETKIDGKVYFHYNKAVYTRAPIFSSFLLLISQGIITYDWRGRVKEDGTGYKDKGHCFRIKPKFRHLLFAETETINLEGEAGISGQLEISGGYSSSLGEQTQLVFE
ncbi:MvaI/BcnI family restriction endonuclease [Rossellomorea aquimaris]|uniref:MvaI/BcnI family restriction endonuclease n=1 Tax=Rossellomorea aquimaris TaxID=189382 RepID=UPI001CD1A098|nr:MvaI/BcnI family restriction endonuclease [Rossellomorea aquimaris]MCA1056967.1 MvaI/BcnI family restriction endonuclease [Rossellomorea aquimaris]